MTYFCFFVIANPACWLRQGVKRSPAHGTRTGSIRSHTRGGQLRNPPTNHASLPMTTLFLSSLRTQGWFGGLAVKQSPAREAVAKSMRYISWRGWLRSPQHPHRQPRQDDPFFILSSQLQAFSRKWSSRHDDLFFTLSSRLQVLLNISRSQ